jgi:5-methylcytosine-specific restriction endonuclease McrA
MYQKICRICRKLKNETEFHKASTSADKLDGRCKSCASKLHKEYWIKNREREIKRCTEYRKNNPEKRKMIQKRWRLNNPEKCRELAMNAYYRNREKCLKRMAKWRENNKELFNKICKEYRINNKDKIDHRKKIRAYLERGAEGSHTIQEWKDLLEVYGGRCARCGRKEDLTKDHIIPISRGGSSNIDNIQPLCRSCNSSKSTKSIRYNQTLCTGQIA